MATDRAHSILRPCLTGDEGRQTQLQAFNNVIKTLYDANVKASLRFPAKLPWEHNRNTTTFNSPEDFEQFADSLLSSWPYKCVVDLKQTNKQKMYWKLQDDLVSQFRLTEIVLIIIAT